MIKEIKTENTNLPAGWEIKTLEEVCERIFAGGDKPKEFSKFKTEKFTIPIYANGEKNKGLYGYTDEAKVLEPSITISGRGTIGYSEIRNEPFTPIVRLIVLKPKKEDVDIKFLKNVVSNLDFINSGSSIPQLTLPMVKGYTFSLPPLPQQKQIVSILDKAFASIDTAKANAEQNLQNAKELFESYLQNVFKNKGDDWEEKKWGELCHFVRGPFGGSLKKSMFKESGYVVYEQKHAIHDHFNQLRYFIDEEKFNEMKRFEVKPGDIIMSCSGTLGRVAIIPDNIPQGIINQALLKLTPNKEINVEFLKHWLRSNIFQTIIFEHSGGAAIPNVPAAKILKEIIIPIPNIKEQKRIVSEIELTLNQTKKLEAIYTQKIDDLEEMKKSVLQKAFSGQLNTIN